MNGFSPKFLKFQYTATVLFRHSIRQTRLSFTSSIFTLIWPAAWEPRDTLTRSRICRQYLSSSPS